MIKSYVAPDSSAPSPNGDRSAPAADGLSGLMVHLTETITSSLDLRGVLQTVTDAGTRLSGARFGAFFYNAVDPSGAGYHLHVLSGADVDRFSAMPAPRLTALFEPTFTGTSTVRIADLAKDPRFAGLPPGHLPLRSYLGAPVIGRDGDSIGALLFGHPDADVFGEQTEQVIAVVAAHAAVAVENARLFEAETAARQLAEERAQSLELLQEITSRLATVLSEDEALDALADTLTRLLGIKRMGVYRRDGDGFRALRSKYPGGVPSAIQTVDANGAHFEWIPMTVPSLGRDAVLTGQTVTVSDRAELAERYPTLVGDLPDIEAAAAVPLQVSDSLIGALALTWTKRMEFSSNDLRMLSAVAEQLAGTLERTRLYAAEKRARVELSRHVSALTEASQTLQRSLLPIEFPSSEHVRVAVRYVPGAVDAEVGGDWYDMVVSPSGRVTLVIGDVQGHSFSAAAVMGRVSTALHAYLLEGHPLDVALRRVNPMVEQSGVLVTCCLMSVDPTTGEVHTARAGHPLPIFARGDLVGEMSGDHGGPPLGVSSADAEWTVDVGTAEPGDRLVLFTDGLVERRSSDIDVQVKELLSVVADGLGSGTEAAADLILSRLPPRHGDDVALLVADYLVSRQTASASLTVTGAEQVSAARSFARDQLLAWGVGEDGRDTAVLLVSELVTNALLHAGGPAELELFLSGGLVRVAVTDLVSHEPARESPDAQTTHGRGVLLVEALAQSWGVEPSGSGKTVWAELACT